MSKKATIPPARSVSDEWRAGSLSKLTFSWVFPLLRLGAKRPLQREDLGFANPSDEVKQHAERLEACLRATDGKSLRALIKAFFSHMTKGALCKGLGDSAAYAQLWAVKTIITYAEMRETGVVEGTVAWPARTIASYFTNAPAAVASPGAPRVVDLAVLLLIIGPMVSGIGLHWFYHYVMIDGLHARSALKSVLFRKLLRVPAVGGNNADGSITAATDGHLTGGLSGPAKGKKEDGGSGKLLNLQNGDARAVENVYHMCVYWIFVPIQIAIYLFVLSQEIGAAAAVGLACMSLAVPAQVLLSGHMKKAQGSLLSASDRRMRGVKETVLGIQAVKTFGWERAFGERVRQAREEELKHNSRVQRLSAISNAVMEAVPIVCALASLASYGLFYPESPLTASRAFVSLLVFNQLRMPLMILPFTIFVTIGGLAAVKRIDEFLGGAEVEPLPDHSNGGGNGSSDGPAVVIEGGVFRWPKSLVERPTAAKPNATIDEEAVAGAPMAEGATTAPFQLGGGEGAPVDLQCAPGLTVILGKVASGKSALLNACLGEMSLVSGAVSVRGRVALCAQTPWIFNASLKENVLFGTPYDAARYQRVIGACALEADLAALPSGDATEIGERGVTLSGGQKARVSLARALYADADVYLLDDVLSAVDAHVGRHLVDRALGAMLVAKGRTVLLASHQLSVIDRADRVVILSGGHVAFDGPPAVCRASEAFAAIRGEHDGEGDLTMAAPASVPPPPRPEAEPSVEAPADGAGASNKGAGKGGGGGDDGNAGGDDECGGVEVQAADLGKLTAAEDRETGSVSMRVLTTYGRLGGCALAALALSLLVAKSGAAVGCQGWVAVWTGKASSPARGNATAALGAYEPSAAYAPFANAHDETMWYISIYALLSLAALLFVLVQQLSCVALSIKASARVHAQAFRAISRAPLSFFETTPTGRILARFGNDMNVVDTMLMKSLNQSGSQFCVLIVVFVMNACLVPWLVVFSLPLFVVCTRRPPHRAPPCTCPPS